MLLHNKKVEVRNPVSRPGTSGDKPSSIARLDTAAGSRIHSQRSSAIELSPSVKAKSDNFNVRCTPGRIALSANKGDQIYAHSRYHDQRNRNDGEARLGLASIRRDQLRPGEVIEFQQAEVPADPLKAPAHDRLGCRCRTPDRSVDGQEEILNGRDLRQLEDRAELYRQSNCEPEALGHLPSEGKQGSQS
jgi:hypothetical protein